MKKLFKIILAFLFLFSAALPFASESAEAAIKKVSYLRDKSKIYVEDWSGQGTIFTKKYTGKFTKYDYKDFYQWTDVKQRDWYSLEKETKDGLYHGGSYAYEFKKKVLAYPIKKNKKWKNKHINADTSLSGYDTFTIISTNRTIKVKAGTFKNVIQVRESEEVPYVTSYYAKGVGLILKEYNETKSKKRKVYELIKIKK
ncbi:hypothetical protein [Peribacillus glennii]|uniref:Uncharacterized protein n=1 Tax=Peribacillus glennii TaxID=2303991 RepID=A0A372L7S7_9BACI|nr:hypothetical protein [Peribacillus glennii]RFU60986.1 hypothetical protein D0466_19885 [Peribacillus glennii]